MQTDEGKLYLFVAIDRTTKFAFVQLVESTNRTIGVRLPGRPDRGGSLQDPHRADRQRHPVHASRRATRMGRQPRSMTHMFDMRCRENGIEHRLTKINHPWTNGQVERMNRTIKEATVKRYHYDSHEQLKTHLADFVNAYNYRPPTQDSQGSYALRIHRQSMDKRAPNDSNSIQPIKCRD